MVFNTTAKTLQQMHSPIASGRADLFEMDGMLVMYRFSDSATDVDIWVLGGLPKQGLDLQAPD
jgi:hypothetical protein